ncbi:MAG: hypothetical protein IID16_12085 [Candidatus Marinimicrobia bacterium]|nr:hypothetical protein [Candidatus Neomarinimicrobiota bacterium]
MDDNIRNILHAILPELTSSQPACADAVIQGGKSDMSQNFTHIYTDKLTASGQLIVAPLGV